MGRRHGADPAAIPVKDLAFETLGGLFSAAGNEKLRLDAVGTLPRVADSQQGARPSFRPLYFKTGGILRLI